LPKIRFSDLPRGFWQHLVRVENRRIPLSDLRRLETLVKSEPLAPDGDWYKDFGSFKLYGRGKYPKTVLIKGMKPFGIEIQSSLPAPR